MYIFYSKLASENKLTNFKSSRPNSVETRRSKSLSVELGEETKKDIKKTRSDPINPEEVKGDTEQIEQEVREIEMTIKETASPLKDSRSSLDTRSDSPKPGCSSQPDIGEQVITTISIHIQKGWKHDTFVVKGQSRAHLLLIWSHNTLYKSHF